MNPSRKGDLAEFYAVTWLWDNGFEVFKNASCTGPVDIMAYKDETVYLFDIKHKESNLRWGHRRTELQKKLGVQIIEFNAATRGLRLVEHNE